MARRAPSSPFPFYPVGFFSLSLSDESEKSVQSRFGLDPWLSLLANERGTNNFASLILSPARARASAAAPTKAGERANSIPPPLLPHSPTSIACLDLRSTAASSLMSGNVRQGKSVKPFRFHPEVKINAEGGKSGRRRR